MQDDYTQKSLESIARMALEGVLSTGRHGFEFSRQIMDYMNNKYYAAARFYADHPSATWVEFHDNWVAEKLEMGWKYEPKINNNKKISKHIYPARFLCASEKEEYKEMRDYILVLLGKERENKPLLLRI